MRLRPSTGELFFTRLNSTDFHAPPGGIERGGWKLTYEMPPGDF